MEILYKKNNVMPTCNGRVGLVGGPLMPAQHETNIIYLFLFYMCTFLFVHGCENMFSIIFLPTTLLTYIIESEKS